MAKQIEYGVDVAWGAREIEAFRIYNRTCGEQARAAFADRVAGRAPRIVPAAQIAAEARAQVAA